MVTAVKFQTSRSQST